MGFVNLLPFPNAEQDWFWALLNFLMLCPTAPIVTIWTVVFARFVENPEEIAEDSECMNCAKYYFTCFKKKFGFFYFHFFYTREHGEGEVGGGRKKYQVMITFLNYVCKNSKKLGFTKTSLSRFLCRFCLIGSVLILHSLNWL